MTWPSRPLGTGIRGTEWWLCSGCDEAYAADALNSPPRCLRCSGAVCTAAFVRLHTRALSVFVGCFQQTWSCFDSPPAPPLLWGRNCAGGVGGLLGPRCHCSSHSASEQFTFVAALGWGSRRVVGAGTQVRGGTWRNRPICSWGEQLNGEWEGHWHLSSLYDQRFG